jgi:hypothetical protein
MLRRAQDMVILRSAKDGCADLWMRVHEAMTSHKMLNDNGVFKDMYCEEPSK